MMPVRELLLDAKKAVAAAVAGAGSAAAAGLLSGPLAGEITAAGAVVTTVLVYLLGNGASAAKAAVADDTGPGTTEPDADIDAEPAPAA
jgi:hypothetical protein